MVATKVIGALVGTLLLVTLMASIITPLTWHVFDMAGNQSAAAMNVSRHTAVSRSDADGWITVVGIAFPIGVLGYLLTDAQRKNKKRKSYENQYSPY